MRKQALKVNHLLDTFLNVNNIKVSNIKKYNKFIQMIYKDIIFFTLTVN